MSLPYGFVKTRIVSEPKLTSLHRAHETQYHLHVKVQVGDATWDVAINVGTSDADDLLKYKLIYDFRHPVTATLAATNPGQSDLTGKNALPALDFCRSDLLANTGAWRDSDTMDGSYASEPVASLRRLLERAKENNLDVYIFGRFYDTGDGIHDTHMNQGSTKGFIHEPGNDKNDHNDIWQDGAVIVDVTDHDVSEWAAYFAAFSQQLVPTDDLGNPKPGAKPIDDAVAIPASSEAERVS
ncbi:MAG TPA: DUF2278 family protein [Paraburkholderia sp.]|nr:DUF2278 family protein [Paraburkholderia sp.]